MDSMLPKIRPLYWKSSSCVLRKALREHLLVVDALPVELVLRRAQQRDQTDIGIVLNGASQELEFPARLAFDVENLRMVVLDL